MGRAERDEDRPQGPARAARPAARLQRCSTQTPMELTPPHGPARPKGEVPVSPAPIPEGLHLGDELDDATSAKVNAEQADHQLTARDNLITRQIVNPRPNGVRRSPRGRSVHRVGADVKGG